MHVRIEQLKRLIEKLREERSPSIEKGESGSIGEAGSSRVADSIDAGGTREGAGTMGVTDTTESLLRTLPDQFLYEKEVEETPGLFLSLYNLPLVNQRFLEEEIPVFEAE